MGIVRFDFFVFSGDWIEYASFVILCTQGMKRRETMLVFVTWPGFVAGAE